MLNFIQPANVVYMKAPRDLTSGDGFTVGKTFAIATVTAKSGAILPGLVEGAVQLNLTTGVTKVGGDAVLFDQATQKIVATGGVSVGYAVEPPPGHTLAAGTAWVKLIPTAV